MKNSNLVAQSNTILICKYNIYTCPHINITSVNKKPVNKCMRKNNTKCLYAEYKEI